MSSVTSAQMSTEQEIAKLKNQLTKLEQKKAVQELERAQNELDEAKRRVSKYQAEEKTNVETIEQKPQTQKMIVTNEKNSEPLNENTSFIQNNQPNIQKGFAEGGPSLNIALERLSLNKFEENSFEKELSQRDPIGPVVGFSYEFTFNPLLSTSSSVNGAILKDESRESVGGRFTDDYENTVKYLRVAQSANFNFYYSGVRIQPFIELGLGLMESKREIKEFAFREEFQGNLYDLGLGVRLRLSKTLEPFLAAKYRKLNVKDYSNDSGFEAKVSDTSYSMSSIMIGLNYRI